MCAMEEFKKEGLRGNVLGKEYFIGEISMSLSWGNNIVVEIGRKIIEYRL